MTSYTAIIIELLDTHVGPWWRHLGIAMVLVGIGGLGWYFYQDYRLDKAQQAQIAFSDLFEERSKALAGSVAWDHMSLSADLAYHAHESTWAGPYLLLIEVDALIRENNIKEAMLVLDKAAQKLTPSNPFWHSIMLKRALLRLSSQDETVRNEAEALELLTALAYDLKNPNRDAALYYLGYAYQVAGNKEKSEEAWRLLKEEFSADDETLSPWVQMIPEYITAAA
jgi:predicted negative regulator of RcsB-dependent stress response